MQGLRQVPLLIFSFFHSQIRPLLRRRAKRLRAAGNGWIRILFYFVIGVGVDVQNLLDAHCHNFFYILIPFVEGTLP